LEPLVLAVEMAVFHESDRKKRKKHELANKVLDPGGLAGVQNKKGHACTIIHFRQSETCSEKLADEPLC
jgi:hypothetical protein